MNKAIKWVDYYTYLEHKGLSPTTIASHRSSINRFILWIKQKETHMADSEELIILQKAFQKHIQLFKKSASRELKWITEQQERKLFAELRLLLGNPKRYRKIIREYAMIALMYFTGIRVEELCNLKLSDVQIHERSGWIYIYGKDNKQRKIDLNKSIRKVLKQYKKEYQGDLKGEYLFGSQRSNQVTTRGVQHIVENYATRLNMPELTCHVLRHTCLHNLVKANVPLSTVAEIAGHLKVDGTPNIDMALRYIKPGEEEKANAMESISWD